MPEAPPAPAAKSTPPAPPAASGSDKPDKPKKEPSVRRSNFENIYPKSAKVTLLVESNPKKQGSKARERFEGYTGAKTIGDAIAAGVTYQDVAYDVGHGFIKVDRDLEAEKKEAEAKAAEEKAKAEAKAKADAKAEAEAEADAKEKTEAA